MWSPGSFDRLVRRTLAAALLLGVTWLAGEPTAVVAADDLSVVGSWRLESVDAGSQHADQFLATFGANGTLIIGMPAAHASGGQAAFVSPGQGVWDASGPGLVALTFVQLYADGSGTPSVTLTVTGTVTVDPADMSFTGAYALSVSAPDGSPLGNFTGTLAGTRITVQPMPSAAVAAPSQ